MEIILIISLSEISTKGKNRNFFIDIIKNTISNKLKEKDISYRLEERDLLLILIFENEEQRSEATTIIIEIIGISWIYWGFSLASNKDDINSAIFKLIDDKKPKSYRLTAKVLKKNIWKSTNDFIYEFAEYIKNKYNLLVDLEKPDLELIIKVFNENKTFIYFRYKKGLNGIPVGSSGKGLVFLSGGIDSPVAAFLAQKRGLEVDFITFLTPITSTEETVAKIIKLATLISKYNSNRSKLYIVNLAKIQRKIMEHSYENYRIILLRRAFIRIGDYISNNLQHYDTIITGESLGQVASQTILSQTVIGEVTKTLITKPLIAFDKEEIITISKKINTYQTSISPGDDTCALFAPKEPIINPSLKKVNLLEERIKDAEQLIQDIVSNDIKIIDL